MSRGSCACIGDRACLRAHRRPRSQRPRPSGRGGRDTVEPQPLRCPGPPRNTTQHRPGSGASAMDTSATPRPSTTPSAQARFIPHVMSRCSAASSEYGHAYRWSSVSTLRYARAATPSTSSPAAPALVDDRGCPRPYVAPRTSRGTASWPHSLQGRRSASTWPGPASRDRLPAHHPLVSAAWSRTTIRITLEVMAGSAQ